MPLGDKGKLCVVFNVQLFWWDLSVSTSEQALRLLKIFRVFQKNCFKDGIFCPMMTMPRWRSTSTINWWRVYNSFLFKRSSCLLIFSNILVWLSIFFCFYFCIKEKQFAKEMKSNLPFLSLKKNKTKTKDKNKKTKKTKRQKRTIERKNERKKWSQNKIEASRQAFRSRLVDEQCSFH